MGVFVLFVCYAKNRFDHSQVDDSQVCFELFTKERPMYVKLGSYTVHTSLKAPDLAQRLNFNYIFHNQIHKTNKQTKKQQSKSEIQINSRHYFHCQRTIKKTMYVWKSAVEKKLVKTE